MVDQLLIGAILLGALTLFVWDRWRYDLVAMFALLVAAALGLVPTNEVFSGFGNAAVITVAAVLVISHAMWRSGVVDALASLMKRVGDKAWIQMLALTSITTFCSAFISNTGTMAIMIPVALQLSRSGLGHASKVLMPMAFGSLLGGTITMIGTPPNIIIADIREDALGESFGIFDFTPVGLSLAVIGLVFMWLTSRWLVPTTNSRDSANSPYDMSSYMTELWVPEGANHVGETLYELESNIKENFAVVAIKQGKTVTTAPPRYYRIKADDVLIIEADTETLQQIIDATGFELNADEELADRFLISDEVQVVEGVVGPDSRLIGRSAADLRLRHRFGVNVLAVARQGQPVKPNLSNIRFKPGDVLLLQGDAEILTDVFRRFGCFPLAQRSMRIGAGKKLFTPLAIFAVAIMLSALGILSVPVAFTAAAGAMVLSNIIPLRELYENVDWPIVVLLGATIPLGAALERSGAAQTLADWALLVSSDAPAAVALSILLLVTVILSNIVNNAAAAVLMAPIALNMASGLNVATDPFLMVVAIGAAIPFITPIGHQSNILVMGPGGYGFGDYWKLGLPLTLVLCVATVPLILWFWPLGV
ncbi:SLC13 family permease [Pseudidiomarina marina]|uniref:SLC13 family permease n=1 Tax=Pseudidiomarina marina TaxID=502366 RepID=A0A432YFZ4_9GAMM|nr:SLC13 family permease [Pseudidiomarina marina]RUO59886.1 SLC13 family permease [Pseudidiomarina marina]